MEPAYALGMELPYAADILIGRPASGKETQAKLMKPHGFFHISTGNMIHDILDNDALKGTPQYGACLVIRKGNFISDELVQSILEPEVARFIKEGDYDPQSMRALIEGYPRKVSQVPLSERIFDCGRVLYLDVPREVCIERQLNRDGDREDKDPVVAERRQRVFDEETAPLLEHYKHVIRIDGTRSIEEIHKDIKDALIFPRF
ncbi:MAG: adenylate kinase family protein [Candidatus Nanoarchaeia archaeon]